MKKGAALDDEAFDRLKNGKLNIDNDAVMVSPNQQETLESVGFDMKAVVSSKQKKKHLKQSKYNEIAMDVLEAHNWEEDARMEGEEEDFPDLFDPNVLIPGKIREGIDLVGGKVIGRRNNGGAKNGKDSYINIGDADIDLEQSNSKKAQVVNNGSEEDVAKSYTYSYVPTVTFDDKDEL